eukprot:TRINITY_DN30853_c0_g1_i1.p1 TRINITY_DN30853_c0_g1~~TRINITY_DN30853_c0_g1_i1.p1  ORF type:complete len:630 (+),score=102.61 TRINITY_DN30853_c0_g1_i1:122-2011(+)
MTIRAQVVEADRIQLPFESRISDQFLQAGESPALALPEFPCKGRTITRVRQWLHLLTNHSLFHLCSGALVLTDTILAICEIDEKASGVAEASTWIAPGRFVLFAIYVLEFLSSLLINWAESFHDTWVQFDAFIVSMGILDYALVLLLGSGGDNIGLLRFFRVARIARILKVFSKLRRLRELRKLIRMTFCCFKTLFWSLVYCFAVMTVWSMISVELLHDKVQNLVDQGVLDGCEHCTAAFDSVMNANLYTFQTVIAGDSWGALAVPLVKQDGWAIIILVGTHITIAFAVLNMIVAVIIDDFAEARNQDEMMIAEELEIRANQDLRRLTKMFDDIDRDGNGEIDLEELFEAASRVPAFAHRLRVMDIDKSDLERLFVLLDSDASGTVDGQEFINALNRWMLESKTASRFVKHQVAQIYEQQDLLRGDIFVRLAAFEERVRSMLSDMQETWQDEGRTGEYISRRPSEPPVDDSGRTDEYPPGHLSPRVVYDSGLGPQHDDSQREALEKKSADEVMESKAGLALADPGDFHCDANAAQLLAKATASLESAMSILVQVADLAQTGHDRKSTSGAESTSAATIHAFPASGEKRLPEKVCAPSVASVSTDEPHSHPVHFEGGGYVSRQLEVNIRV